MLCLAWRANPVGSIPNDDLVLARLTGLSPDAWMGCKPAVLAAFVLGTDNRWHQKRMRREYQKMCEHRKAKSEAGKKGMEKRWRKSNENAYAHNSVITVPITNDNFTSSSTSTKKESTPKPPAGAEAPGGAARAFDQKAGFGEFWAAYPPECPRKAEKAKCEDYYRSQIKGEGVYRALMRALEMDKASPDWQKNGGQFINAPLVWLHKKRWLDDLDETQGGHGASGASGRGGDRMHAQGDREAMEGRESRPVAGKDAGDDELLARHRNNLEGIGYQGQALEEAMMEFREALSQ
jgi:uncharacterized protein YdaU (DUF1376 family)